MCSPCSTLLICPNYFNLLYSSDSSASIFSQVHGPYCVLLIVPYYYCLVPFQVPMFLSLIPFPPHSICCKCTVRLAWTFLHIFRWINCSFFHNVPSTRDTRLFLLYILSSECRHLHIICLCWQPISSDFLKICHSNLFLNLY